MLFDGHDITGYTPDRVTKRGISRTYQNIRLFKNMTSVENIMVGMHPHLRSGLLGSIFRNRGTMKEEQDAVAESKRLLAYVGLKGKGDYLSKEFIPMEINASLKLPARWQASQNCSCWTNPPRA